MKIRLGLEFSVKREPRHAEYEIIELDSDTEPASEDMPDEEPLVRKVGFRPNDE